MTERPEPVQPNCTANENDCHTGINVVFFFDIVKTKNYLKVLPQLLVQSRCSPLNIAVKYHTDNFNYDNQRQ